VEKRIYRIVAGGGGESVTSPSLQPPPFTPSQSSWYYKNRFGNVGLQRLCLCLCFCVCACAVGLWLLPGRKLCVYITEYNRNVIPLAIVSPRHMVGTPYLLTRTPRIVVVVIITPTDTPRDPPPSSSPNLSSFPLCPGYCARVHVCVCVRIFICIIYIYIQHARTHLYTYMYYLLPPPPQSPLLQCSAHSRVHIDSL